MLCRPPSFSICGTSRTRGPSFFFSVGLVSLQVVSTWAPRPPTSSFKHDADHRKQSITLVPYRMRLPRVVSHLAPGALYFPRAVTILLSDHTCSFGLAVDVFSCLFPSRILLSRILPSRIYLIGSGLDLLLVPLR
jgi:hypothetical protein